MADPLSIHVDPRVTPARPRSRRQASGRQLKAARFVEGKLRKVVAPQAPVRHEPRPDALLDTEALKGERVTVYETTEEGWSWGQLQSDGYVGWLPTEALGDVGPPATHRVAVMRTLVFPGPSIKTSADRSAVVWLPAVDRAHRAAVRRHRREWIRAASAPCRGASCKNAISSPSPSDSSARPICGAARPALGLDCSALGAALVERLRRALPARQRHAGDSHSCRLSNRRPISPTCSAATSCSGKATSPSCATPRRSSTPTPSTWRSRSSRSRKRWRASAPPAARSRSIRRLEGLVQ